MSALILAEHDNETLAPATANVVTAASQMSETVTLLVAGFNSASVVEQARQLAGVTQVIHIDAELYETPMAEDIAQLLFEQIEGVSHLLAAASTFGKSILPRVAALCDVQMISEITRVIEPDTFERPVYAGNAMQIEQSQDALKVVTVRPTTFDAAAEGGAANLVTKEAAAATGLTRFVSRDLNNSDRPELTSAKVVVSGGRGLGSQESFTLLDSLAEKLNAAVGASRAAVDAGFVPNDYQVGQTGKIVAPDLYIAVGISGAIQHLAGMKDSKVIVAINKDEEAPIFQVADYGLVADLFEAVPELIEAL